MKPLKRSIRLRLIISLILILAVIALTGCSDPMYPSGRFLSAFSLYETVKRMNVHELTPSIGSGVGDSSAGDPTRHRREFAQEFSVKDTPGSRFDEHSFLLKLEVAIKQEARSANVHVTGTGSGGDSFYFRYQDGGNHGDVEVIGARLENDRYKIWCVVRELSVPNKS